MYVRMYVSMFIFISLNKLRYHACCTSSCFFILHLSVFLSPVVMRQSYWTNLGHGSKMMGNTGCTLSPIQVLLDFLAVKDES